MSISSVSAVFYCTDGYAPVIFRAIPFDLGGTAKSRNFAYVRAHRRPVHSPLAFGLSQAHR